MQDLVIGDPDDHGTSSYRLAWRHDSGRALALLAVRNPPDAPRAPVAAMGALYGSDGIVVVEFDRASRITGLSGPVSLLVGDPEAFVSRQLSELLAAVTDGRPHRLVPCEGGYGDDNALVFDDGQQPAWIRATRISNHEGGRVVVSIPPEGLSPPITIEHDESAPA